MTERNGNRRILIGSPVRQSPAILQRFFHALKWLKQDQLELDYYFIDNNDEAESSRLLAQFAADHKGVTIEAATENSSTYLRNETTHYWNDELIWKVAAFKDRMIDHAREEGYDGLFLIDSDLLLHPDTLSHLVAAEVDIVSEIFWTRWQPEAAPQPQVWVRDEYVQWEQRRGEQLSDQQLAERYYAFLEKLRKPGLYEVGGLGACTLISRRALEAGVNFKPIPNLSYWGEDRHFCIRAAAIGLKLFVDTHCPAFHIYRSSDLEESDAYLDRCAAESDAGVISRIEIRNPRPALTLSMVVKNEANRYLEQALRIHRQYIGRAVIIDDGSTDGTAELVQRSLEGIPLTLIRNEQSRFSNEVTLRKQQWEETVRDHPGWILNLDADEWFESRFESSLDAMLEQTDYDVFCFRLYDFWSPTHYREDMYWNAQHYYRPFLVRYKPDFVPRWKETPQHCGRFPENVLELPHTLSNLRLKHMGWADPNHRLEKWKRYKQLDPDAKYGWSAQYDSILDETPNLIEWQE